MATYESDVNHRACLQRPPHPLSPRCGKICVVVIILAVLACQFSPDATAVDGASLWLSILLSFFPLDQAIGVRHRRRTLRRSVLRIQT
ncbi:hypothetical protein GCM10010277_12540 [Streptomyces longisporoflavus]|uniref:hypothetical protein n=1 Tax=Streptomyces longisporoflavus TaxID=28044 RepID=UPI00167C9DF1|nr:hypothetical protein [Streptomyces longisporoflavus]GGV29619.1 hypothetical protein GCM10010277_12540 [Streptomyces longisporoflavus]